MPSGGKGGLTLPHATSVLAQWLAGKVRCHAITALKGGICSPVFRLEFDRAPHSAVVKLQDAGKDDPMPREPQRLDYHERGCWSILGTR